MRRRTQNQIKKQNLSEQQSPKKEQERETDDKYTPTPAHKYGERIRWCH